MFEYLLTMGLGCLAGLFTGMLPGFGPFAAVLIMFAWLLSWDPLHIIVFYAAMLSACQYSGSISAIYFGVPGESNSLIASRVGLRFHHRGWAGETIGLVAISSLIAAMVSVLLIWGNFFLMDRLALFYSIKIQALVIVLVLLFLIVYQGNRTWLQNVWQVPLGLFVGSIGYNNIQGYSLTLGQDWLLSGISTTLVVVLCFVLPNMLRYRGQKSPVSKSRNIEFLKSIMISWKHKSSIIRGSVIGVLAGLIPGVGLSVSSNLAYAAEKKFANKQMAQLSAAEAANNSAGISCLLPLLIFGVPILASEALILAAMTTKHIIIGQDWFQTVQSASGVSNLDILLLMLILSNLVMFAVCWVLAPLLARLYSKANPDFLLVVILSVLTLTFIYDSLYNLRYLADAFAALFLIPLSVYLVQKKIDGLPLAFAFLMSDSVIRTWATLSAFF
jgi:putative tricarboxylic transport membrane protein